MEFQWFQWLLGLKSVFFVLGHGFLTGLNVSLEVFNEFEMDVKNGVELGCVNGLLILLDPDTVIIHFEFGTLSAKAQHGRVMQGLFWRDGTGLLYSTSWLMACW
jgi:hypothetical protein